MAGDQQLQKHAYGTFDESMKDLEETNRMIYHSRQMLAESETMGGEVLNEINVQGDQLRSAHRSLQDTKQITSDASRSITTLGRKAATNRCFLWTIILLLCIADLLTFYYFFFKK